MLNKLLCNEDNSLLKVLNIINENARGIAFIVNDSNVLKGIVTDGDIRRLLLSGINLDEKIGKNLNATFTYAKVTDNLQDIARKIDSRVKIIPIVDSSMVVKDFYELGNKSFIPVANPTFDGNEFKYLTDALLSTWISSKGKYINRFESEFSNFCENKYGVATSNGTVAIHLALTALGIKAGDEVIVPDLTFAATINAVIYTGATPVIVDVELDTCCISPKEIEKAITAKTKAIIPVHIYGIPCDMDKIMAIAEENNLYVIEDCAEAHGAEYKGKKVGSFGHVSTFSFFANKIITSGEGGMCVTNDEQLDTKMRILRDHGMNPNHRYWHDSVGFNYRMTNLQAAIGVAQFEKITHILEERNKINEKYKTLFKDKKEVVFFSSPPYDCKTVTWLVCALIKDENRDEFINAYKKIGVELRPFFYPLCAMDIYKNYAKSDCPNSRKLSETGLISQHIST